MPVFHITAPDGTAYEVNGPDGATEQDALAQVLAQHVAAPTPPPQTSQTLGFEQGLNTVGDNLAQGVKKVANIAFPYLGDITDAAGQVGGLPSTEQAVKSHTDAANPALNGNVQPGKLGKFAGETLATLPAMAAGPISGGALAGGLTADPNSGVTGHALGAGLGAGVGAAFSGLGSLIAPHASDAVTRLANAGVTMTPGQIFGGVAKGVEDRLSGFPIADYFIKGAQRGSLRSFGNAAGNEAMRPLGMGNNVIPAGVSGQDMSQAAHDAFDNAYGQVLPQIGVTLGQPFAQTVADAGDRVAARLPDQYTDQFGGTLADVFKKMNSGAPGPNNSFPGTAVHDAMSDLGSESRAYRSPTANPNDRALGGAYGDVREGLRSSINTSDPYAGPVLQNIDSAYRGFIPVDKAISRATGNGGGLEAGVFTPQQLRSAVVGGDQSVRRVASSQGQVPLQQLAEDGIQVLPSSIADSGTAGRLALPAMAAEAAANPASAAKAAALSLAVPALYSRPGLAATNAMFARQAGPGATALGDLLSRLGAPVGGGVAGAMAGARR